MADLIIIGGGLAGCEAAWQAAENGIDVFLYEMRPFLQTEAHISDELAELVCSNSFGSILSNRASGLIKNELRKFPSLLLNIAEKYSLPAGSALAVDRELFSKSVTLSIKNHPRITLIRQEVHEIPATTCIIASGPLTSKKLAQQISLLTGEENLFFFDAIAPICTAESINMEIAFRASRYQRGKQDVGDYINCPFIKSDYDTFIDELIHAERIQLHEFETAITEDNPSISSNYFEGCLPVEVIALRGHNSLAFGPMRPVGLRNPHTGDMPYAVVQLRQDDLQGSLYNLVGFQTNLKYAEQKRVFSMIPGLEHAEFVRYGQMHRNTFISSPKLLFPTLQMKKNPEIFFAGQITGVEGYMGNIATGLIAGINAVRFLNGYPLLEFPVTTLIGALCHYITHSSENNFQPMKANLGLLPPTEVKIKSKKERGFLYAERSMSDLDVFIKQNDI